MDWGITPKVMWWIYLTTIRPVLLYGSVVWWKRATLDAGMRPLDCVQRLALRMVTSCFPTTATRALESLFDLRPLHIAVVEEAMMAYARLKRTGELVTTSVHGSISRMANGYSTAIVTMREDFCIKNEEVLLR